MIYNSRQADIGQYEHLLTVRFELPNDTNWYTDGLQHNSIRHKINQHESGVEEGSARAFDSYQIHGMLVSTLRGSVEVAFEPNSYSEGLAPLFIPADTMVNLNLLPIGRSSDSISNIDRYGDIQFWTESADEARVTVTFYGSSEGRVAPASFNSDGGGPFLV